MASNTGTEENSDIIIRAGDVNVISVELFSSHHKTSFKLDNIWQNISIFENIRTNYIEGQITIVETQDLFNTIPIILNEKVVIKFTTPGATEPTVVTGQVVEIPSRQQIKQGMNLYVLGFISPEFVYNQKVKFSRSFVATRISDMATDIYNQHIFPIRQKKINVVPTLKQIDRVIPNMSPFKAINWISKWAISPSYRDGASYMFFENKYGFYFGPLEALVDQNIHAKAAATYRQGIVHGQQQDIKNVATGFFNIIDVDIRPPNHIDTILKGGFSSCVKSHDIVKRSIDEYRLNYFEHHKRIKHTEGSGDSRVVHNDKRLGKYYSSSIIYEPDHFQVFTNDRQPSTNLSAIRNAQLHNLFGFRLDVTVPGDSDRTIGEIVELEFPSSSPALDDVQGELDPYLSGRYLITSLRHSIDRGSDNILKHEMVMELSKDSYSSVLPDQLVNHWGS